MLNLLSEAKAEPVLTFLASRLKEPPFYQVILYHDLYTPPGFFEQIMTRIFLMNQKQASTNLERLQQHGQVIAGIYSREIAETKVDQVKVYANQHEYHVHCEFIQIE